MADPPRVSSSAERESLRTPSRVILPSRPFSAGGDGSPAGAGPASGPAPEGAVAALHAAVLGEPDARARLRAVADFAPVTRMETSIGAARRVSFRAPGTGVVSALIGLMLRGAATTDPALAALLDADGLSDAARDSWGGIAPGRIGGARGAEMFRRLDASFAENEVARLRGFRVPVRIDAARFDEVAPAPLTARLLRDYRCAGVDLTSHWWPTHHSGVMRARHAPGDAARWIAERLRG